MAGILYTPPPFIHPSSLHDSFGGLDGSEEHLALSWLLLRNTVPSPRGDRDGFDSFGGFGGCGGFGRDGYPP